MCFGRNRVSNVLAYMTNGIFYDQNDLINHKIELYDKKWASYLLFLDVS